MQVSTDLVYIARYLQGVMPLVPQSFRAIDPTIPSDTIIANRIATARPSLDVDMNGQVAVSTDLVYIARYRQGVTPVVPQSFRAIDPTIPSDATIANRIAALCP